jgi:hypothetical protein
MSKIKFLHPKKLYNFVVDNFFHLESSTILKFYLKLNFLKKIDSSF